MLNKLLLIWGSRDLLSVAWDRGLKEVAERGGWKESQSSR
jgi:hypothetical protein